MLAQGLVISHLDGHHHCHKHPLIAPVAEKLASEYVIPLRPIKGIVEYNGKRLAFSDAFYGEAVSEALLIATVKDYHGKADVLEIMVYPALVDEPLLKTSGYTTDRARELAVLTAPSLPGELATLGVTVDDYTCLDESV